MKQPQVEEQRDLSSHPNAYNIPITHPCGEKFIESVVCEYSSLVGWLNDPHIFRGNLSQGNHFLSSCILLRHIVRGYSFSVDIFFPLTKSVQNREPLFQNGWATGFSRPENHCIMVFA